MDHFQDAHSTAAPASEMPIGPSPKRRILVLCFDGTGNKFQGNGGDSNIIKIFRMLDHAAPDYFTYYQPGIGTYVANSRLSKAGRLAKAHSAYLKAKDQAVGTSFDEHVREGYQFLMRHYHEGAEIYMFGFSRGAYTVRFLAQMLDNVGLLSSGNEANFRFAWKAFASWQTRLDETEEQRKQKKENWEFMRAYRDTFSRPIRRIRFMGLFDTVNSVPRFENAWMKRSKFPYTAKSSALVVRHAVSIDERRAKFRQNLVSQKREIDQTFFHPKHHLENLEDEVIEGLGLDRHHQHYPKNKNEPRSSMPKRQNTLERRGASDFGRFKPKHASRPTGNLQPAPPSRRSSRVSIDSTVGALEATRTAAEDYEEEDVPQDLQEIWFPGTHADIGGGWPLSKGEEVSLSHAPLLWMIREARAAGLPFDEEKLRDTGYLLDDTISEPGAFAAVTKPDAPTIPSIHVDGQRAPPEDQQTAAIDEEKYAEIKATLEKAWCHGTSHDSLEFGQGVSAGGVLLWRMMEWMPFTRFDLRPDGSWQPIRWPLPRGETRDIPDSAWIHHSALKRMEARPEYRPGNLIVGGGGRGIRIAPASAGVGEWDVYQEKNDIIGEVYIRKPRKKAPVNGNGASKA